MATSAWTFRWPTTVPHVSFPNEKTQGEWGIIFYRVALVYTNGGVIKLTTFVVGFVCFLLIFVWRSPSDSLLTRASFREVCSYLFHTSKLLKGSWFWVLILDVCKNSPLYITTSQLTILVHPGGWQSNRLPAIIASWWYISCADNKLGYLCGLTHLCCWRTIPKS